MKIKILQLNAWTGRLKGSLLQFFEDNQFDIICLQEAVWSENGSLVGNKQIENFAVTVDQIKAATGLQYELRGANWGMEIANDQDKMLQGNVILSKFALKNPKVKTICGKYNDKTLFYDNPTPAYTVLSAEIDNGIYLLNYHGYWEKTPIGDATTQEMMRRAASEIPRNNEQPVIMCGDLNVIHDSPAMAEVSFLHDLTAEYHIENTLNGLKFNGRVACDHILVNDLVRTADFKTVDNIISDHKGLIAELEIDGK